jgi:hypothetical protein
MGFVQNDGKTLKASSATFTQIYNWLNQRTMLSCGKNSKGTWVVKLANNDGYYSWIIWNEDGTMTMTIPKEWSAVQMQNLAGNIFDITNTNQLTVGPAPIQVEDSSMLHASDKLAGAIQLSIKSRSDMYLSISEG